MMHDTDPIAGERVALPYRSERRCLADLREDFVHAVGGGYTTNSISRVWWWILLAMPLTFTVGVILFAVGITTTGVYTPLPVVGASLTLCSLWLLIYLWFSAIDKACAIIEKWKLVATHGGATEHTAMHGFFARITIGDYTIPPTKAGVARIRVILEEVQCVDEAEASQAINEFVDLMRAR